MFPLVHIDASYSLTELSAVVTRNHVFVFELVRCWLVGCFLVVMFRFEYFYVLLHEGLLITCSPAPVWDELEGVFFVRIISFLLKFFVM